MSRKWTQAQQNAIKYSDGNLLVSAGAGSGKSSVLVERLMERITREDNPVMLDRMLILTFSKASCADLREKIRNELFKRIKEDPENKLLIRQKDKLAYANISTLDSFYYSIVDRYRFELGIPSSLHIFEGADIAELETEAMEDTLDYIHLGKTKVSTEQFNELKRDFTNTDVKKAFIDLYNELSSTVNGTDTLKNFENDLESISDKTFFNCRMGEFIAEKTSEIFKHYQTKYKEALEIWALYPKTAKNYYGPFASEINNAEIILKKLESKEKSYTEIKTLIDGISPETLGRAKTGEAPPEDIAAYYKKIRKDYLGAVKLLQSGYYAPSEDVLIEMCRTASEKIKFIHEILTVFDKFYSNIKNRLSVLTFDDVTKNALKLVYSNGAPTKEAKEISALYDEVYIDEYQDTSPIQDMIINCIAPENSKFIVGDIKQCIYAFRGSDPSLFARYRDLYQNYTEGVKGDATIFLSENFRCSERIISTVNRVFETIFGTDSNIISYKEEDELHYNKTDGNASDEKVKLILSDKEVCESDTVIASEVKRLINNRVSPSDIMILALKTKQCNAICDALSRCGIPCASASKTTISSENDLMILYSLLKLIDNYDDEISTVSVLMSPLYQMSLDDITAIRIKFGKKEKLYDSLLKCEDERVVQFIKDTDELRNASYGMSASEIVLSVLDEYGVRRKLLCQKGADSVRIQNNLNTIYDLALKSEASSFKGLHEFVLKLDKLYKNNTQIGNEDNAEKANAVKVMTIHKSKGLEAPHVILGYVEKNLYDSRVSEKGIIFNPELGLGLQQRAKGGFIRFNTPLTQSVIENNKKKQLDEEQRLLYVAMTRAQKSLTIVGSVKNPQDYLSSLNFKSNGYDGFEMYKDNNFLDWICVPLFRTPASDDCKLEIFENQEECYFSKETQAEGNCACRYNEAVEAKIKESIEYCYPFEKASKIPAKLTVSKLYPGILDELDESGEITSAGEYSLRKPNFDRRTRNDGAFTGTATHLFMQFCDFESVVRHGIEYEIERLVNDCFIDAKNAKAISKEHLKAFFESSVFTEMRNAKFLERELRFNTLLPGEYFTENESERLELLGEKILVQGVIDCYYETKDGKTVLLDYKTDAIRNRAEDEFCKMLRNRHSLQLKYYKMAMENITGIKVDKTVLYSFALGKTVEII